MSLPSFVVTLLSIGVIFSTEVSGQELCPGAGPLEVPKRRSGSTAPDPCDALRILLPVVAKCAAEFPETQELQIHAAGILLLERQRMVDLGVLTSMRKMSESPQLLQSANIDSAAWTRRTDIAVAQLAKTDAELATQRQRAVAAGYNQLSEAGVAQKVISSAVWRQIAAEARDFFAACTTDTGREAARQFVSSLAVMMSHGNGFEREIIRRILESAPK